MKLEELISKIRKFAEKVDPKSEYYISQGMTVHDSKKWHFALNISVKKRAGLMSKIMRTAITGVRYGPSYAVWGVTSVAMGYTLEGLTKPITGIKNGDYVKKLLNHIAKVLGAEDKIEFTDGSEYQFLREEKIKISAKIKKDSLEVKVAPFRLIKHPLIAKLIGTDRVTCPYCNQETAVYSGRCEHCGKPIITLCRKCKRVTPIGEKCIHCGAKL